MERKPPEKILQLKAVCIMLPFSFKYETNEPPEAHSGTALLYLGMTSVILMNVLLHLIFCLAPGSTSRPGDWPP